MTGSQHALLLRDFVNTYDVQCGIEEFGKPTDLGGWLAERGLAATGARVDRTDLGLAVGLREGLRAAMAAHQEPGDAAEPAELDQVLAAIPLRLSFTGGPALLPVHGGVRGALARLAAAVVESTAEGTWSRLKVCRACRWAFLDTSRNRSRTWCSMRMCGNRAKTRAYRARRRHAVTG